MQRPIESGWIGRTLAAIRAVFGVDTSGVTAPMSEPVSAPHVVAVEVLELPSLVDVAAALVALPAPRMLAARIAVQAKLNVPVGKKPRVSPIASARIVTPRPQQVAVVKRSPKARSVYLQARHTASRTAAAIVPNPRANVVALPVAKTVRPIAVRPKQPRQTRIAA